MVDSAAGLSQVRRDLADLKRKRRAALTSRWLRGIGRGTRPVVYLGPMVLVILWLLAYVDLPSPFFDRLTLIDFFLIGGCVVGFFGIAIPVMLFLLNVDGGEIDWEAWGCVGIGLVAAIMAVWATIWLAL